MSKLVWAFDVEVCELLDETKRVASHLIEPDGEQFLDRVPELLRRIEVLEEQPEFHRYFSQAAVRIAGEAVGYVSLHALTLEELLQFLRSIEGYDEASAALQVANLAGLAGEPADSVASRKKELRGEAAVAAEIADATHSPRAEEPAGDRPAAQPSPPTPRLQVKWEPSPHVILDGKLPVPLEQDEASCLEVLLEARDWRSGRIVGDKTGIVRADRPMKSLREKLASHEVIEVDQNCGSRVKPAWLA